MSMRVSGGTHIEGRVSKAGRLVSKRSSGLGRATDVALGGVTLILVAPLIAVTVLVSWLLARTLRGTGRDPRSTWLGAFLYKSSLAELPLPLEVVRGRASLAEDGEPMVEAHPADRSDVRAPASSAQPVSGYHQQVRAHSAGTDLGRNLREAFIAKAGAEFDDLLRAIDRAQSAFGVRPDAMPAGAR